MLLSTALEKIADELEIPYADDTLLSVMLDDIIAEIKRLKL